MKSKLLTIALMVVLLVLCTSYVVQAAQLSDVQAQGLFVEFMKRFTKSYELDHFFKRFNIFRENVQWIIDWNDNKENTHQVGINFFADLLPEEWVHYKGLKIPEGWVEPDYEKGNQLKTEDDPVIQEIIQNNELSFKLGERPKEVDWNENGTMLPVRDQQSCGSCYTYSALAAVEALYKIKYPDEPYSYFSTQQALDCTGSRYGCSYCSGGWMTSVFNYLIDVKGACLDSDYPYRNRRTTCKDDQCDKAFYFNKYRDISGASQETTLTHLTINPLAIAVTSANREFMYYKSGIITNCGSTRTQIDHAVTAVGYNESNDDPNKNFVLIRNSWSSRWGDQGHVKIALNGQNLCRWRSNVSYPVLIQPQSNIDQK